MNAAVKGLVDALEACALRALECERTFNSKNEARDIRSVARAALAAFEKREPPIDWKGRYELAAESLRQFVALMDDDERPFSEWESVRLLAIAALDTAVLGPREPTKETP